METVGKKAKRLDCKTLLGRGHVVVHFAFPVDHRLDHRSLMPSTRRRIASKYRPDALLKNVTPVSSWGSGVLVAAPPSQQARLVFDRAGSFSDSMQKKVDKSPVGGSPVLALRAVPFMLYRAAQ